ncbi:MAG: transglutaminase-like cysteine peptidase [Azonexus sp.]|nr:transglutaminase-like cysteine peptidase [Azonexus sp.]
MRKHPALLRLLAVGALVGTLGLLGLSAAFGLDFERLQQGLISRFGPGPAVLFTDWQRLLSDGKAASESEKLRRVNDFFNRRIAFDDDISIWRQADYWATPIDLIGQGRGDCEDFSISKYFSLINLGIPVSKLRLVYVKALQNGPGGPVQQAHMVLAYYATPSADPLVLDNLNTEIRPASRRTDLSPIFSFNSAGLWQGTGNQSSKSNLSRWQDLLARARAEGFE